jgi:hypothetical protein
MSQERKDEICKKFDIDEKTLRKAGRETDDGRIVVDLLRIDHLCHTPELWDECYNAFIKDDCFNSEIKWEFDNINDMLLRMLHIYYLMNSMTKGKKYVSNTHNDLLVQYAYKNVIKWVNKAKYDLNDVDYVKFCCYQIYTRIRILIETDLNLIKP